MIKNERLRHGLVVAGTVAAALGGGIGGAQAAEVGALAPALVGVAQDAGATAQPVVGDELPELGNQVAASGAATGLDSITEASPILIGGNTDLSILQNLFGGPHG
ncbi:hypothetical protein [Streptomyces sp. NPDC060031]|uniref:hypothetical protein n=1 Tax=Streptomyces sp. NPDC060031 TaxID=3347043 RepID=UPI0036C07693